MRDCVNSYNGTTREEQHAMDHGQFDSMTRSFGAGCSRRTVATSVASGAVALLLGRFGFGGNDMEAAGSVTDERKKKGKGDKQKLKLNAFRCVEVGGKCRGSDSNCCSGICEGKKPKKGKKDTSKCVSHNAGECQAGDDVCLGVNPGCGEGGSCHRTTGNASFCGLGGSCFDCQKDADCETAFGAGAACVICFIDCGESLTACVPPRA
jgi:hypothetical protein